MIKSTLAKKRNMLIASVILVIGIGGAYLQLGNFQLTSVALCTIFWYVNELILPKQAASEKALEAEKKRKKNKNTLIS